MTRLLPIQGVVLSISFPRVSLRSALGYVLNGLTGRVFKIDILPETIFED